ncbi:MAG: ATP-binding cassette domain-containing protein, partial [Anaerolineae bacterium]|nr:ATP-binding cassette domain-containing protein [Anaerolineae bacterium]
MNNGAILQVKDIRFYYHTEAGPVKAVDGVTFDLERGIKLGLVGESGCGKSTMAMAIMRLLKPPGKLESGELLLDGVDLAQLSEEQMRQARLRKISLILQGAMNSLNPVSKVKDQLLDGMKDHGVKFTRQQAAARVEELLDAVDLASSVADMYPHELSGGMKQRVCVAMAISMQPQVV